MIDFKNELNEEQLTVVLKGDGPCLVLAGAGSGKTRVITYRTAFLLERNISPNNILLVTFTNKASQEMIKRVQELTELKEKLPWAGTFHHLAFKLLKKYATRMGFTQNFSILDADDSLALIKLCIKNLSIDLEGQKFPSARVVNDLISFSRNAQTTLEEAVAFKAPILEKWLEEIKEIARDYEARKIRTNVMDFDDLLENLNRLLNQTEILEKYSKQFKYVLVDEYQDINKLQAEIIYKLSSFHKNILAVGDDAQSIYSFRAADINNILNFEKTFPEAQIFKLETNYRSSEEILSLANAVIANNTKQYFKNLKTIFQSGLKPLLTPQFDQETEANFIIKKIEEYLEQGYFPKDIAVLFRATHHAQRLELALVKAGIAYDFRGGLRFFERAHIKDVLAYLRILNNILDESAWRRVLLKEVGIGPASIEKIISQITKDTKLEEISFIGSVLSTKAKIGWESFLKIWEALLVTEKTPAKLIRAVLESGYSDYLETEYLDSVDRQSDLEQLVIYAGKYIDLTDFLNEANLTEDYGQKKEMSKIPAEQKIVLSTVHQSKGLEWSAVFIINMTSGNFPNSRALAELDGLEEERRLFYVAITRAKKNLFLTYPIESGVWGEAISGPSLFLEEIDISLLDDKSLLKTQTTSFLNDPIAGVEYIDELDSKSLKIRPGSFLRDLDDL